MGEHPRNRARRIAADLDEQTLYAPYRATISTCVDCGQTYANLWAHLEECSGKTVTPVELCGRGEGHWVSRCGKPKGHEGPCSIRENE